MGVLSNPKHELFAQEVAKGTTLEAAYERAGYAASRKNAQRLRSNEGVSSRIEEILSQAAERTGVTVDRITEELVHIAFADITDAVRWGEAIVAARPGSEDGDDDFVMIQGIELRPSEELPKRVSAAISEVRKTKEGLAIKFHDKIAALDKLGKQLGMFKDKVELSGKDGGPIEISDNPLDRARRIAFALEKGARSKG